MIIRLPRGLGTEWGWGNTETQALGGCEGNKDKDRDGEKQSDRDRERSWVELASQQAGSSGTSTRGHRGHRPPSYSSTDLRAKVEYSCMSEDLHSGPGSNYLSHPWVPSLALLGPLSFCLHNEMCQARLRISQNHLKILWR